MFKFKISFVSDSIFVFGATFLLSFIISYYFFKDNAPSIAISLPFGIICLCLFLIINKKKRGKLSIKKEDEENFLKCLSAVCLASREENEDLVFRTLDRLGKKPIKVLGGITTEDYFFKVKLTYDQVTADGVVKAYKNSPKGKNLAFVGVKFSDEATTFAEGFEKRIKLIPLTELFPLLKKTDNLPEGGYIPQKKKASFLTLLKGTFKKGKAKTYAVYGVFLLIMSRLVFYPIWYIISGSIFLIYAITIKFFAPSATEDTFL